MKIFKTISVGLAVMFISVNGHIASAQDFLKGLEAADNGDYQTALIEWSPLAEQGDADAQYNLGCCQTNENSHQIDGAA